MKAVKEFLRNHLILNEKAGRIGEIMTPYSEEDFEQKVTVQELNELMDLLDACISIRKKMKSEKETLEKDIKAKDYLTEILKQRGLSS